jgi:hypothetical protein
MFSVPLIRQVTLPGRYPAHCPLEFGLSSSSATSLARLAKAAVVWLAATFNYRMTTSAFALPARPEEFRGWEMGVG